jgi:hypothetical protein
MAAYMVFNYRITDQDAYKPYLGKVVDTLKAHGAEIVVADFESEAPDSESRPTRRPALGRRASNTGSAGGSGDGRSLRRAGQFDRQYLASAVNDRWSSASAWRG